jgi:hypothetical protein
MKALLRSICLSVLSISCSSNNDNNAISYPSFGSKIDVTINALAFDAMEHFLSPNGNYLVFNNLNDGINTKLYYANKVTDSTFNFEGELLGTNQATPPHLDAVADMDMDRNFY